MRSRQLETAIANFVNDAAAHLQAELDAGAEVPFELESHGPRGQGQEQGQGQGQGRWPGKGRGRAQGQGAQLYCYRPLTEAFIGERWQALASLESCGAAERLLECLQGLDRYLLQCDIRIGRGDRRSRATVVLRTLLEEVFAEHNDFALDDERLRAALARLDATAFTNAGEVALIETLHGMGMVAPELAHTRAPAIGRPELAWALARFEMGCERSSELEALSDHLLALRALLEPEGPASGLLAGRLAALCAVPEERAGLTRRTLKAIALEREAITGAAVEHASCDALVAELAGHLRAVLRDVVSGHLPPDLVRCADSLLSAQEPTQQGPPEPALEGPIKARRGPAKPAYQPDDQINTTIMRMRRLAARSGEEIPNSPSQHPTVEHAPAVVEMT